MAAEDERPNPRGVLRGLPEILMGFDADGVIRLLAGPVRELTGYEPDDWIGRSALALVHPDDLAAAMSALGTIQQKDMGETMEVRSRRSDGTWGVYEVVARNCLDDPEVGLVLMSSRDVTARRRMGVNQTYSERLFAMVDQSPTILFATDTDGVVLAVSQAVTRLLGIDPSHVRQRHLRELVDPADHPQVDRLLASVSHGRAEARLRDTEGRSRLFRLELTNLATDPLTSGFVISASDITELDRARQALTRLASVDPLTGLANRRTLVDRLEGWILAGVPLTLFYVDLDGFKAVNDRFGHGAGDVVLREMGSRLGTTVVDGELAARVGGDEFALMTSGDRVRVETLREHVRSALRQPTEVEGATVHLDASIGVARWHPDAGEVPTTADLLLAEADRAMYAQKAEQRAPHP